ncbi:MAG: 4Fe-4S cluster-binding domain-containing protein [Blautia sp.]|nr:4Fe-4S cluster-binding domain-containing protein [Blautia sp.]
MESHKALKILCFLYFATDTTYESLRGRRILELADVLVDGPFLLEQKDAGLAFRGSRNQRILSLEKGAAHGL